MKYGIALKSSALALLGIGLLATTVYAEDLTIGSTIDPSQSQQPSQDKNLKMGEQFLATNKVKPGVVTLADGLQYKVLTKGNGPVPKATDTVVVNYAGRLIDGTEFDSSYKRGQPATFPVGGVIPGWVEALQLMPVGSSWEIYIPSKLAYGEQGMPPAIGPNETLIFKVELIGIQKS